MSTNRGAPAAPVTKAEFEAGLKALEERLAERFERMLFAQQAKDALAEFDRISEIRDTNPGRYTVDDVPHLVKEVRKEPR